MSPPQHESALAEALEEDDIQVQYHPAYAQSPQVYRFEDYEGFREHPPPPPPSATPWDPWRSRLDFEVAKLALDANMNEKQTNHLLEILNKLAKYAREGRTEETCSIKSAKEMKDLWELAAVKATQVRLYVPVFTLLTDKHTTVQGNRGDRAV